MAWPTCRARSRAQRKLSSPTAYLLSSARLGTILPMLRPTHFVCRPHLRTTVGQGSLEGGFATWRGKIVSSHK